jgi:hypothetical protein
VKALIRQTFPEDPITAVAVAMAESELYAGAYNPEPHKDRNGNIICTGSVGVMQIGCVHKREDKYALHDIELNLQKARVIYDEAKKRTGNGWQPWGAYTDKRYLAYLR